jgi:MtN3 and saliva related transmembrane protein
MIEALGMIAALLTSAAFAPQAIKTIRTRSTEDLSLSTFLLQSSGNVLWLVYGLAIFNKPVIIANVITSTLVLIILYYKITEKNRA